MAATPPTWPAPAAAPVHPAQPAAAPLSKFAQRLEWVAYSVSPYIGSACIMAGVFSTRLLEARLVHWFRLLCIYAFTVSLWAMVAIWSTYGVNYCVRHGIFAAVRRFVTRWATWIWRHLLETQKFFVVKVALGCILITLGVYVPAWLYQHFDFLLILRNTTELLWNMVYWIWNAPELARVVQRWLDQNAIAKIIAPLSVLVEFGLCLIEHSIWMGALVVAATLASFVVVTLLGLALYKWWSAVAPPALQPHAARQ